MGLCGSQNLLLLIFDKLYMHSSKFFYLFLHTINHRNFSWQISGWKMNEWHGKRRFKEGNSKTISGWILYLCSPHTLLSILSNFLFFSLLSLEIIQWPEIHIETLIWFENSSNYKTIRECAICFRNVIILFLAVPIKLHGFAFHSFICK